MAEGERKEVESLFLVLRRNKSLKNHFVARGGLVGRSHPPRRRGSGVEDSWSRVVSTPSVRL